MKKLLLIISLLASSMLYAAEIKPYSETIFQELQEKGAPILIDINAKWCGTCKKQGKVIDEYIKTLLESQDITNRFKIKKLNQHYMQIIKLDNDIVKQNLIKQIKFEKENKNLKYRWLNKFTKNIFSLQKSTQITKNFTKENSLHAHGAPRGF